MKVLIFGATGTTGRNLVSQALEQEHVVSAFVRNPSRFDINHERVNILKGDVGEYQSVENAVMDQDAVIYRLWVRPVLLNGISL